MTAAPAVPGALIVGLSAGAVTGRNPLLGVTAAAALVYLVVVLRDLAVGVCLFLLVTFLDVVSRNQNLSLTKAAGAVLALSWLVASVKPRSPTRVMTTHVPWLTAAVVTFLAWSGMSAFWADSAGAAMRSTFRFGLDSLLIPITLCAVRERKHVRWLFAVFVLGTLLSVGWGLTQGKVAGGAAAQQIGRLSGANVEANVLATLLVVTMIFAGALAFVTRRAPLPRALAALATVTACAAFFGTFSRGGLIALGVVLLAGCLFAGSSRPAFVALVVAIALVGAVFLETTTSGAVQRLTSTSTSGRADIWKVGMSIVQAHPIVGVGSGNYMIVEPNYILAVSGPIHAGDFIIDNPYPAHNIYLELAAEMGVVGLTLFLSVVGLSIRAAVRATRIFQARGERDMEFLSRALVIAITGMLAADFFVSDQYSKQLWLLLALCPALLAIARDPPPIRVRALSRRLPATGQGLTAPAPQG